MPITIPAASIETFQRNAVTVETHTAAALVRIESDFPNNSVMFTFNHGTPSSNSFVPGLTPGPLTGIVTVLVNTVTGTWSSSTGQNGTLSGGQLTTLNSNQRTLRNGAETVANALAIIPGTVVAWT